jgi:hypothetical protein
MLKSSSLSTGGGAFSVFLGMGDFMAIYHGDRKYAKFWVMHEKKIKI